MLVSTVPVFLTCFTVLLCGCFYFVLSKSKKLFNLVTMRRLLTRVINRVLLNGPFTPVTSFEADIHSQGRRKLVVGLGNPGMEGTRHSVGMAVLGALASRLGVADRWRGDKHVSGEVIMSEVQQTRVVLLRPRLLMNVNGVSVARAGGPAMRERREAACVSVSCNVRMFAEKYGVRPEDILLVHDDLDKPLGKIAIKHGGSARGHNGVRSCVDCLQTDVMPRLRVGIGRPVEKSSVEQYILGRFSSQEQKVLDSVLVKSVDLLFSQLDSQQDSGCPSSPAGGRLTAQKRRETELSASAANQNTASGTGSPQQ